MNWSARITIAILVSLLSYEVAQACSPAEPMIWVKCSNTQVPILSNRQPRSGEAITETRNLWLEDTYKNLSKVVAICNENLRPVINVAREKIQSWVNNRKRTFLDGDLIFEPYSSMREMQLQKGKNDLLSCSYEEFERIDNWLVITKTSRAYCQDFWYSPGACPDIIFSLSLFLIFLAINPNLTTLPYLILFIVMIALLGKAWLLFLKGRSPISRRRLAIESLILFPLTLHLIFIPTWFVGQLGGWIMGTYLLARWMRPIVSVWQVSSKQGAG